MYKDIKDKLENISGEQKTEKNSIANLKKNQI